MASSSLTRGKPSALTDVVLAIHGGAGVIRRAEMTGAAELRYRRALERALKAGYAVLAQGKCSLDAVVAAVKVLEDTPLFNAGRGAVFSRDGRIELDASIMDGKTRRAGGVSCVTTVKNPILAARAVMERTPHVLLTGKAADRLARQAGLTIVDPDYFRTQRRWNQLQHWLKGQRGKSAADGQSPTYKYGTVGAVALDRDGNLAAATSTGGTTGRMSGRSSDSSIIGAGNYADNATCAVSTTGQGEYFIRGAIAYDVAALMRYSALPLAQAADTAIHRHLTELGGEGGLIALDASGNCAMPFNTEGMFRASITRTGKVHVAIYR